MINPNTEENAMHLKLDSCPTICSNRPSKDSIAKLLFFAAVLIIQPKQSLADNPVSAGPIVTVTRQVAEFTQIEQQLMQIARARDAARLANMMTFLFECRFSFSANEPISRDTWIAQTIDTAPQSWSIKFMAVHDRGDTAVVDFVLHIVPTDRTSNTNDLFVVDVWVRNGDEWKLDSRYLSPLGEKDVIQTSRDRKEK